MGRFNASEAENYGGNGGSSFFSLKDDGDIARVRFLYNGMEDVVGYAVHEYTGDDGKTHYVNCLREYNEPKANCPFCADGKFQKAKLYIPLYDEDEEEVKLWERGKNFFAKLSSICSRYSSGNKPLVSNVFEVERHGKKGDTSTTYEIFKVDDDNKTLDDFPEIPEVLGTIIADKSFEDMNYYLDNGSFPSDNSTGEARRSRRDTADDERPSGRRTPSRRGESF